MATKQKYAEYIVPVRPKTQAMEALLQPAYHLTVEEAKRLVEAHEANPAHVPWDAYKEAKAFLAAYETKAVVVSERQAWRRGRGD